MGDAAVRPATATPRCRRPRSRHRPSPGWHVRLQGRSARRGLFNNSSDRGSPGGLLTTRVEAVFAGDGQEGVLTEPHDLVGWTVPCSSYEEIIIGPHVSRLVAAWPPARRAGGATRRPASSRRRAPVSGLNLTEVRERAKAHGIGARGPRTGARCAGVQVQGGHRKAGSGTSPARKALESHPHAENSVSQKPIFGESRFQAL